MLTSKQRAQLRSLASNEDVIMQVGKSGVTEAMVKTVSDALEARELIKMRVLENSGEEVRDVAEQLAAELRLLFVCLARKANGDQATAASHQQTLDEERLAILEDYFNIGLKDPDCSKAQLATLLGVGERQLTRILSEVYHSSFSEILLRSRMNIAQAMVIEGRKNAEQIAEAVGYRSADALKRAYRSHFGESLKTK